MVDVYLVTPEMLEGRNGCPVVDYIENFVLLQDPPVVCSLYWPAMDANGRPTKSLCMVVCSNLPSIHAPAIGDLLGVDWMGSMDPTKQLPQLSQRTRDAIDARGLPNEIKIASTEGGVLNNIIQYLDPNARRVWPE